MLQVLVAGKHLVNRKAFIPLALCAIMIAQSSSASANVAVVPYISCFVVNETTGRPVVGIRVDVVSARTGQLVAQRNTDGGGRCLFENLPKGHPVWVIVRTSRGPRQFGIWVAGSQVPFPNAPADRRHQTMRVSP